jgi:hypothetical protein
MARTGRPSGQMTQRRRQVLEAYADAAADGQRISWAALARRCGLYDYRDAKRIASELQRMGAI